MSVLQTGTGTKTRFPSGDGIDLERVALLDERGDPPPRPITTPTYEDYCDMWSYSRSARHFVKMSRKRRRVGPRRVSMRRSSSNRFGLVDMIGNVNEWCLDEFTPGDHAVPADASAWMPETPAYVKHRIARGGSWNEIVKYCGSGYRNRTQASRGTYGVGLRVALSPRRTAKDVIHFARSVISSYA